MGDAADREESITINRQTLYDMVWSKPAAYLARDYGISDVALAKICRALNVPKPPRGYWAKVRRGRKLARPMLQPDSTVSRTHVLIRPRSERPPRPERTPEAPKIPAAAELRDPHQLVARTAAALKREKADRDGLLLPSGENTLRIEVSKANSERALLIMDALLKALEQRGHRLAVQTNNRQRDAVVTVNGEQLALRLRERLARSPHTMTATERRDFLKYGRESYAKYDYKPSGELRVVAYRLDYRFSELRWSDSARRPLEQHVGDVVVGIEAFAAKLRQERIERQEASRQRDEEARQRHEEKRRREEEAQMFEQLRNDAACWREAKQLRAYLPRPRILGPVRRPCC